MACDEGGARLSVCRGGGLWHAAAVGELVCQVFACGVLAGFYLPVGGALVYSRAMLAVAVVRECFSHVVAASCQEPAMPDLGWRRFCGRPCRAKYFLWQALLGL